jgi:hypothetical protein
MSSFEIPVLRTHELKPLPTDSFHEDLQGRDKVVRKMTDGKLVIAAKIYRDFQIGRFKMPDLDEPINKPIEALREIQAYSILRQTPLGIYVPEPYFLLDDEHGTIIGLGVEWREGKRLDRYHETDRSQLLRPDELLELQERFDQTVQLGIYPKVDMLSAWNILVDPEKPQRLFFGECGIDDTPIFLRYSPDAFEELCHYSIK